MSRTRLSAVLSAALLLALPVMAATGADAYKTRCAACHAPDGSGTATGKKMGARPLGSADVQKQSDAALAATIAKGKGKMPGYGSRLSAAEIQAVVTHIRTLAKK